MELNLARSYRRQLGDSLGRSHLPLVTGFEAPTNPGRHAVTSLDWWFAPSPDGGSAVPPAADHARLVAARHAAVSAAFAALASSPRRLAAFRKLLAETQRLVPIREEQAREWTLPWPALRRAVQRIGEALAAAGAIPGPDDVFFLDRAEAIAALRGEPLPPGSDPSARRTTWERQRALMAPMTVGHVNPFLQRLWESFPRFLGAVHSDSALVSGTPASPGRATGAVRVIHGPEQFDELQPGEILVAPITAPAWTPLFTRAAAVVTDVGNAAAHASIIAREYGIPAVVGCVDATVRLRTGMRVTDDGGTGNVEPE
jgi:pyruvate,water dikinase